MSCELVSNKARKLNQLYSQGILGEEMDVKSPESIPSINNQLRLDAQKLIGKVPTEVEPIRINGLMDSGAYAIEVDEDFFMRLDAAEDIEYTDNEKYIGNASYPVLDEPQNESEEETYGRLVELLQNIGVTVQYANTGELAGIADTFSKLITLSFDKANLGTLSEEAAHMFVSFIKNNEPKLFNTLMADVTKLPLYKEVKEAYMPIYQDIARVQEEAVGKALRDYLALGRNDGDVPMVRTWLEKIVDRFRRALASVGITSIYDYNNMFRITANKILGGELQGEFQGEEKYFDTDGSLTPMAKLDAMAEAITFDPVEHKYFFNKKQIQFSVTQKIKAQSRRANIPQSAKGIALSKLGTDGHDDLRDLWKRKINGTDFTPKTSNAIVSKLSDFVDEVYNQFPGAKFRVEVPIFDNNKTAGTIDVLIEDVDGYVHILDYKFSEKEATYLKEDHDKQLKDYRRILRTYGFDKFGQVRVIPIKMYHEQVNGQTKFKDIEIGNNTADTEDYLRPLPSIVERTNIQKIDDILGFLEENLNATIKTQPTEEVDKQERFERIAKIRRAIADLQINRDVTPLSELARNDLSRMEKIMESENATASELQELYKLASHYEDFVKKGYAHNKDGELVEELAEVANFSHVNGVAIEEKLEAFWRTQGIDVRNAVKPTNWWSRLTRLSDYDLPAFQALKRLLDVGYTDNEIKRRKSREEIAGIIKQVREESKESGVKVFDPILATDSNGLKSGRLIGTKDKTWYDMHRAVWDDRKLRLGLNKYFDTAKWDEYLNPLIDQYRSRNEGAEDLDQRVAAYKNRMIEDHGLGNANSTFYKVPDEFLNQDWRKYVRDAPNSGLAKLYNKFIETNEYAYENSDTNISRTFLPYVRKDSLDTLMDSGFALGKIPANAIESLRNYEWETYDLDSNGQRIYKIPLKYGTPVKNRDLDQQSYDLGEILYMWADSVNTNAFLQQTRSTAELYGLALSKSKQIVIKNRKPVLANGVLRTTKLDDETTDQFQEYLNMYYFGVRDEGSDITIGGNGQNDTTGVSLHKLTKAAVKLFSAKTLAFQPFSAVSNLTGGFANSIAIGARGNNFTNRQLTKAISSIFDTKARALVTLMDIDAGAFERNKANSLSINQVNKVLTWDNLFILQRKGDWLLQNSTLLAMAQNFGVKDGKIVKDHGGSPLIDSLDFGTDGKLEIKGLDLNTDEGMRELLNWREVVRGVNSEIIGSTSEQDKFLAGNTLMGQLALQFRRWMLPMGVSRFGTMRYNEVQKEFNYGRYRSTASVLFDSRILKTLGEFIREQNSPSLREILKERYEAHRLLNPSLSYDQFIQVYKQNMKSMIGEAGVFAVVSMLLSALKGDDDEEVSSINRFFIRALSRTSNEISFWFNAESFLNIVQVPIPLLSAIEDFFGLLGAAKSTIVGSVTDDDDMIAKAKLGEKTQRMFIGTNAYWQFMNEMDKSDNE